MKELVNIQAQLRAPKTQTNNYGHYNYRRCEDILEAVKPLLKDNKCMLILSDDVMHIGERYYVMATATITNEKGDEESATALAQEGEPQGGMSPAQGTGSASSYARKYALCGLLAIDDNRDPDDLDTRVQPTPAKPVAAQTERVLSPEEIAIREMRNAKSRASFELAMKRHMKLWGNPLVKGVMAEVAKKYPKEIK